MEKCDKYEITVIKGCPSENALNGIRDDIAVDIESLDPSVKNFINTSSVCILFPR